MPMLFTFPAAAEELMISTSGVIRLVNKGALPVVRIGGNARISQEDLVSFINAQKVVLTPQPVVPVEVEEPKLRKRGRPRKLPIAGKTTTTTETENARA